MKTRNEIELERARAALERERAEAEREIARLEASLRPPRLPWIWIILGGIILALLLALAAPLPAGAQGRPPAPLPFDPPSHGQIMAPFRAAGWTVAERVSWGLVNTSATDPADRLGALVLTSGYGRTVVRVAGVSADFWPGLEDATRASREAALGRLLAAALPGWRAGPAWLRAELAAAHVAREGYDRRVALEGGWTLRLEVKPFPDRSRLIILSVTSPDVALPEAQP